MAHSLEVIRRVYDDDDGVWIEVGPDADSLGLVQVSVPDPESRKYYGDIRFCMTEKQARLLALALISCADDMAGDAKPTEGGGER